MGIRRWPSWQRIRFDPQHCRISCRRQTGLDLGATAKAWAADRAAAKLAAAQAAAFWSASAGMLPLPVSYLQAGGASACRT
jgi:hypothetical protein